MSEGADLETGRAPLRLVAGGADQAEHDRSCLVLYIAGQTPKSRAAIANLRRLCEEHLGNACSVEVVDVSTDPARAVADQVLALPTLVRRLPPPIKRIIGTLADTDKVLLGLELRSGVRP